MPLAFSGAWTTDDALRIDEWMNPWDSIAALKFVFLCHIILHENLGKRNQCHKAAILVSREFLFSSRVHLLTETPILPPHFEHNKTCKIMESIPIPQPWSTRSVKISLFWYITFTEGQYGPDSWSSAWLSHEVLMLRFRLCQIPGARGWNALGKMGIYCPVGKAKKMLQW